MEYMEARMQDRYEAYEGEPKVTDEMVRAALLAFQSGDMDWSEQDEELMRFALFEALKASQVSRKTWERIKAANPMDSTR